MANNNFVERFGFIIFTVIAFVVVLVALSFFYYCVSIFIDCNDSSNKSEQVLLQKEFATTSYVITQDDNYDCKMDDDQKMLFVLDVLVKLKDEYVREQIVEPGTIMTDSLIKEYDTIFDSFLRNKLKQLKLEVKDGQY